MDCGHVERLVCGLAGWRSRRGRGGWQSLVVVVDKTPLLGALAVWGAATAAVMNAVLKPARAYGACEMAVRREGLVVAAVDARVAHVEVCLVIEETCIAANGLGHTMINRGVQKTAMPKSIDKLKAWGHGEHNLQVDRAWHNHTPPNKTSSGDPWGNTSRQTSQTHHHRPSLLSSR